MNIHDLLIAWGMGRALNDPPNDYPSMAPFARLMPQRRVLIARNGERYHVEPLPIETHALVDAVISAMSDREQHDAIRLYYVEGKKDGAIARKLGRSKSGAREIRRNGEHYLKGRFAAIVTD